MKVQKNIFKHTLTHTQSRNTRENKSKNNDNATLRLAKLLPPLPSSPQTSLRYTLLLVARSSVQYIFHFKLEFNNTQFTVLVCSSLFLNFQLSQPSRLTNHIYNTYVIGANRDRVRARLLKK